MIGFEVPADDTDRIGDDERCTTRLDEGRVDKRRARRDRVAETRACRDVVERGGLVVGCREQEGAVVAELQGVDLAARPC